MLLHPWHELEGGRLRMRPAASDKAARCCCRVAAADGTQAATPARAVFWRRGGEATGWLLPSVTLLLLPKCPACVAAYFALLSGIGISFGTASVLRSAVIFLCVGMLVSLFLWRLRRLALRSSSSSSSCILLKP